MSLAPQNPTNQLHQTRKTKAESSHGIIEGNFANGLVIISDHARNTVPDAYNNLGLPDSEFERHIAYDIGAEALTKGLAKALNVPTVYSKFSRLLIDPNRGLDDPTLIMKISDGALVPGNIDICAAEKQYRIDNFYQPYHDAVECLVEKAIAEGHPPKVFSIHSFTPFWKGVARPWHAGVLWEKDDRFARPIIDGLAADKSIVVGENQPYQGGVEGESVDKHARAKGLQTALIEVRQDLIDSKSGVDEWIERLAQILSQIKV